nr:c-type cytochrome [Deltaproteobacteria bacterium]
MAAGPLGDPATVQTGRRVFAQSCLACHAANGGGRIGPNLTDSAWLHGSRPTRIFAGGQRGRAHPGHARLGPAARHGAGTGRGGLRAHAQGHQRRRRQAPQGTAARL